MPGGESIEKEDEANLVQAGDSHYSRHGMLNLLFQFRLPHSRVRRKYSTVNFRLFKNYDRTAIILFLVTVLISKI